MNPPLRTEDDRQALIDGLRDGHDRLHRHRPRAARARREGGAVRAGADGHDRPGDGVRRGLHRARLPGVLPLALVVEKLTRGRGAAGPADAARSRVGEPAEPRARRPRRGVGGRRGRLREPLGELLLRRAHAARPGPARRSPPAASPTASAAFARGALHDARPPTSCSRTARASTATPCGAAAARSTGEVVFTTGMSRLPGVDDRPVASPASSSPSPTRTSATTASARRRWSPTASTRARAIMRAAVEHRGRARRRARLAGLAARLRHPGDHRRRHARARAPHPQRGRDARRRLPGGDDRGARRASGSPPSRAWSAATSPAR